MKNDHAPKSGGADFLNIKKSGNFWKKSSLTILFTSIDFSSCHFFSLHLSSSFCLLEPKISASNGGEEEDICFVFRVVHVFVHARKICGRHSSADFARKMGKVSNFELGL
jgi:hypothetical protein